MKLIPLSGIYGSSIGNYAMVDDEDYEFLSNFNWVAIKGRHTFYVAYSQRTKGVKRTYYMHRVILKLEDRSIFGDHKDGNGFNNQRSNLRIATQSQNNANRKKEDNVTSKYMGVMKVKIGFRSICRKDNIQHRKYFKTEIEAALWYNEMATKLHGGFARLNTI